MTDLNHGVPPALLADEIQRYSLMQHGPQRPAYGQLALSHDDVPVPESVHYTLSPGDIDDAVAELAGRLELSYGDTWAAVRALAAGDRDVESLAAAIVELARDPEAGTLALSASDPTAADRSDYARRGWALPDGSYPIGNAAQLRAAAVLAASGHGDVEAARKLIRRRAAELNVSLSELPGFRESTEVRLTDIGDGNLIDPVTLSAVTTPEGFGDADEIASRYPELFKIKIHRSGAEFSGRAVKPGTPATTRNRAHRPEEEHIADPDQPREGGQIHPEVAKYLAMLHDNRFTSGKARRPGGPEKPYGATVVHHPYRGR